MSLGKAVIKACFMEEDMAKYATMEADNALSCMFHEKVSNEVRKSKSNLTSILYSLQEVAQYMKRKFESNYKSNWHCIVGKLQKSNLIKQVIISSRLLCRT